MKLKRRLIENYKKYREEFYRVLLRIPRIYYYKPVNLESYRKDYILKAITPYYKIRFFNKESIEEVKRLLDKILK